MSTLIRIHAGGMPRPLGNVYERLLATLGTADFGATVHDAIGSLTAGARRLYLFEATSRRDSSLHYFACEPGLTALFPAYRKHYLPRDPVGDAYGAAPVCGDLALQRIAPDDIGTSGFRRRFFDEAGIVERLSFIQRGAEGWRVMNVARHASQGCCSDDEVGALTSLAALVLPMLPQQRVRKTEAAPLSVEQLEQRFAACSGGLTRRELQVCARAALGMSVDATAQALGIAGTSVVTYRQRAYQRLGVTSAVELCALVAH